MPSVVALAKRALITALKSVARTYDVRVDLTQDSTDAAVRSAYRRVLRQSKYFGRSCSFPVTRTTSADDAPPVSADKKATARKRKEREGDVDAHEARRG